MVRPLSELLRRKQVASPIANRSEFARIVGLFSCLSSCRSIVPGFCILFSAKVIVALHPSTSELFGGLYVHDVKLPLDKSGIESGMDVQLGYRGGKIPGTPLQAYVFGAVNTAGNTNYAAVGLSAKFGKRIYIRPGLGCQDRERVPCPAPSPTDRHG